MLHISSSIEYNIMGACWNSPKRIKPPPNTYINCPQTTTYPHKICSNTYLSIFYQMGTDPLDKICWICKIHISLSYLIGSLNSLPSWISFSFFFANHSDKCVATRTCLKKIVLVMIEAWNPCRWRVHHSRTIASAILLPMALPLQPLQWKHIQHRPHEWRER